MYFDGRLRHLGQADIGDLQSMLAKVSEPVWLQNPFRQTAYKVHRQTRSLIFRQVRADDPADHFDLPIYLAWRGLLEPILAQVSHNYGTGDYSRIILANLPAGCSIPPHKDHGDTYALTHRVHIPIQTSDEVSFHIDGEDFALREGEMYEINNLCDHGVTNNSDYDRVHLIVDFLESDVANRSSGKLDP